MRLVVQIPCHDEAENLPAVLAGVPRQIEGIADVRVVVVDDGSTDGTAEVARRHGAERVVRHRARRGLSAAFTSGLLAALEMGADVVVNTDGDNQYCGEGIAAVVGPIVAERADLVVGDRGVLADPRVPRAKRWVARIGNAVVRRVSGARVHDAPSGLRAYSRELALRLALSQPFSHTIETLVAASAWGMAIEEVPIRTNAVRRPSRLFPNLRTYVAHSAGALLRGYAIHRPLRAFGWMAVPLFAVALGLGLRFLWHWLEEPTVSRHVQSLLLAAVCALVGTSLLAIGIVADALRSQRAMVEELLWRARRADSEERSHRSGERSSALDASP